MCTVNDKQILITGATNGIGLAAEALAALGGNLAVVGRARQNPNCVSSHQGGAGRGATVATFLADPASPVG